MATQHVEPLLTCEELAAALRIDVEQIDELRRRKKWPHVRLTRWDVRFTPTQFDAIVQAHTVEAAAESLPAPTSIAGLTPRSAARHQGGR